jgi:hypothetical protein
MRELADAGRIQSFMAALGSVAETDATCYLTGGATAVLIGWRQSTIDVDIRLVPEADRLLREIQRLKDDLRINVELVSPADFVPVAPGWEDRSIFVARLGRLGFYHFDPYAQALAKLERGHARDLGDVRAMWERGLVQPEGMRRYFEVIRPELFRFPAVDAEAFRRRVDEAFPTPPSPPGARAGAP